MSSVLPGCTAPDEVAEKASYSTPLPAVASVTLPAEIAPHAALVAAESLEVGDKAVVISGTGTGALVNAGLGTTRIGVEGRTGDVWSSGRVELRDRAHVSGSIRGTTQVVLGVGASIEGGIQGAPASRFVDLTFSTSVQSSTVDVALEPAERRELPPGNYRSLLLKQNSVLELRSGRYSFHDVMINSGARLALDSVCGSVQLQVATGFTYRGSVENVGVGSKSGLSVTYFGTSAAHIETPFVGYIAAPRAELILTQGTHRGRFLAKHVRVQAGATIIFDDAVPLSGTYCDAQSSPTAHCEAGLCCPNPREGGAPIRGSSCNEPTDSNCVIGSGLRDELVATIATPLVFGREGTDTLSDGQRDSFLLGGPGADVLCGSGTRTVLHGGDGNDLLRARGTDVTLIPGAGDDVLRVDSGRAIAITFDSCELSAADRFEIGASASLVLFTQRTRAQLAQAGVAVPANVDVRHLAPRRCESTCSGAPVCGPEERCVDLGEAAGMRCEPKSRPLVVSEPDFVERYPSLPPEVRDLLVQHLRAILNGKLLELAPTLLRAQASLLIPLLRATALAETQSFALRTAEIEALGSLYVPATVPALREIALGSFDESLVDDAHGQNAALWSAGQRTAIRWLQARSTKGEVSASDALLRVARDGDSAARESAALAFLQVGDTATRRELLAATLPAASQYVLSLSIQELDE